MTITLSPRERLRLRGFCTGPEDGAPAPGQVDVNRRAVCCTCQREVAVTVRGRYAHHKPRNTACEL